MPNYALGFNRVSRGAIGAGVNGAPFVVQVSVQERSQKYLGSIHWTVTEPDLTVPATAPNYLIRIAVVENPADSLLNVTDFSPILYNSADTFIRNRAGTVYFDSVFYMPQNQFCSFKEPIFFDEGQNIYVIASCAYAPGDSLLSVPIRNVGLSITGWVGRKNLNYGIR